MLGFDPGRAANAREKDPDSDKPAVQGGTYSTLENRYGW
jgi:hypothetical protein